VLISKKKANVIVPNCQILFRQKKGKQKKMFPIFIMSRKRVLFLIEHNATTTKEVLVIQKRQQRVTSKFVQRKEKNRF
jgi:hypothetical protein